MDFYAHPEFYVQASKIFLYYYIAEAFGKEVGNGQTNQASKKRSGTIKKEDKK